MFICLCNCITEEEVITAIFEGCNTPIEVQRYFNHKFDCGICRKDIKNMLKGLKGTNEEEGYIRHIDKKYVKGWDTIFIKQIKSTI